MPNRIYVGTASDFTNVAKEYTTTQDGISLWDQVLTGLQQTSNLQEDYLQASTDYDISQAYSNYLQSQRQLQSASNLETGFKEQLESSLQSAYQTAFTQAKTSQAEGLADIQQQYQENVNAAETEFSELGEEMYGTSEQLFNYLSTYGSNIKGYENIDWSGNLEQQGIYTQDADGNLVLTEKGKDVMSIALLDTLALEDDTTISFERWLGEQDSDALENYRQHYDMFRSGFGIEPGTIARTEDEEQYRTLASEFAEFYEGEEQNFENYEQRADYYLSKGFGKEEGGIPAYNTAKALFVDNRNAITDKKAKIALNDIGISSKDFKLTTIGKKGRLINIPNNTKLTEVQSQTLKDLGFVETREGWTYFYNESNKGLGDTGSGGSRW